MLTVFLWVAAMHRIHRRSALKQARKRNALRVAMAHATKNAVAPAFVKDGRGSVGQP